MAAHYRLVRDHPQGAAPNGLNLVSMAVLLCSIVGLILILIGVAREGTSPLVVLLPLVIGCWAILTLRK